MTRRPRLRDVWIWAGMAGTVVASGCAADQGRASRSAGRTSAPDPVAIVYEVSDEAALPLVAALAERTERRAIVPAEFQPDGAGSVAKAERKALPEEVGRPLSGRLELRRHSRTFVARLSLYRRKSESVRKAASRHPESSEFNGAPLVVYELQLSPAELPLIIDDLGAAGAFSEQSRPGGGARLAVGGKGESKLKDWTPEPRLDDLAERVLREGERVPKKLPGKPGQARVTVVPSR